MSDPMSKSDPKAQSLTIQVSLDEATSGGEYVNMARIFHNQTVSNTTGRTLSDAARWWCAARRVAQPRMMRGPWFRYGEYCW